MPRCRPIKAAKAAAFTVGALGLAQGCTYPTDVDPFPQQLTPFTLAQSDPQDGSSGQPLNPVIRLTFSDFPDPATFQSPALQLLAGGQTVQTALRFDLVNRQVLLQPGSNLSAGTAYMLSLTPDLHSLAGASLAAAATVHFQTGAQTVQKPPPAKVPASAILGDLGILRTACTLPGTCHIPSQTAAAIRGLDFSQTSQDIVNHLTSTVARGTPEGLDLVEPYHPEDSYLLRKLLGYKGFTRIEGSPMPLDPVTLAPTSPLNDQVLQEISDWIQEGAPAQ